MSNYGLKSSPKDIDVFTANVSQLRSLSTKNSLKIYKWGNTAQQALSGDQASVEVVHGLGYAPSILVFANVSGTYYPVGGNDDISGTFAYSDSSKLYINAYNAYDKLTVLPPCRYYILADKAQTYTGVSNSTATGDYGMKQSPDGINVEEGNEYELGASSKFKSLQYYSESIKTETLTLPAIFPSYNSQTLEEYQYVDFNHGLGYPPLFLAWFTTSSIYSEVPYNTYSSVLGSDEITQSYFTNYQVNAFCDSTKIRVMFKRKLLFDYYEFVGENGGSYFSPGLLSVPSFSEETITVKVLPFTEDLTKV